MIPWFHTHCFLFPFSRTNYIPDMFLHTTKTCTIHLGHSSWAAESQVLRKEQIFKSPDLVVHDLKKLQLARVKSHYTMSSQVAANSRWLE